MREGDAGPKPPKKPRTLDQMTINELWARTRTNGRQRI
jgi:hypothetical protein